jgi:PAS domain S-box-containing protein
MSSYYIMHHKLLLRQIGEFYKDSPLAPELYQLLEELDESYADAEKNEEARTQQEKKPQTDSKSAEVPAETTILQLAALLKEEINKRNAAEQERELLKKHLIASKHVVNIDSWEIDSETKFRYLIDNCADVILIRNADKKIVYCSDSVYGVIGYKADELIGKETLNDIYPDDLHIVLGHWDKVLECPGIPITITYRRIHKDGRCIWCEGTSTNMLHQPEIRGVVVNFRDVTEMKEAELALKASERKFRHMISYGADAIMIMDRERKAVFVSESFERITGFAANEIFGVTTLNAIHPDDRAVMSEHWETLENNPDKPTYVTYRRQKKDGTYIWCEGTGINLLDRPEVAGFLLNFRDITERKEAEDALKQSNEGLQKSNAELDRFVYSVSHDLRAPLTSMLGLTLIAKNETEDQNMLNYLDMLQESIGKLDGFIHDILDHSRNARLEIRRQQIDFAELLADIASNLKFMNRDTPVNLRTNINESIAYYSDRSRVGIILNNLVSNAIRYYNPNATDPSVDITIAPQGDDIMIQVNDNGIGIDDDQQKKVFDMFYRVSHHSTGSGLGLYIVKEAVDKLDGEIRLESELTKGTCITVLIPNMTKNR